MSNIVNMPKYQDTLAKKAQRAILIKQQIDALSAELKEINAEIAEAVKFEDGKKTAYADFGDIRAKVQQKETVKWDQEKLNIFRQRYPSEFEMLFKTEYKPISMKLVYQTKGEVAAALDSCVEIKPATPYVTYEYMGGE